VALSNWDTLAFNHEGESCCGVFENHLGNKVELYKNWLYIHSPAMWVEGGAYFSEPVIAQITHGYVYLAGFHVCATRGPQEAVFAVVLSHDEGDYTKPRFSGGIGCYGFKTSEDMAREIFTRLGKEVPEDDYRNWVDGSTTYGGGHTTRHLTHLDTYEKVIYYDNITDGDEEEAGFDDWMGVKPSTVLDYFEWVRESAELGEFANKDDIQAWLERCKNSGELRRYNQGDAFFAQAFGQQIPSTKPGQQETPVLLDFLKGEDDEKGDS
jgi:hypothetical protein